MTPEQEKEAFEMIWDGLMTQSTARPSLSPKGFVLGGQPGAGKSRLVTKLGLELHRDLLIINGDEFRRYHPDFDQIQLQYGKDAPKHTAAFSAKMTELVLDRTLREQYNVSIEGTFRTAEVPMASWIKCANTVIKLPFTSKPRQPKSVGRAPWSVTTICSVSVKCRDIPIKPITI